MWLQCFFLFLCTQCFGLILPIHRKTKAEAKMYYKLFVRVFFLWTHLPYFYCCFLCYQFAVWKYGQWSTFYSLSLTYNLYAFEIWNIFVCRIVAFWIKFDESPIRMRKKQNQKSVFDLVSDVESKFFWLCCVCFQWQVKHRKQYDSVKAYHTFCPSISLNHWIWLVFNFDTVKCRGFLLVCLYMHAVNLLGIFIFIMHHRCITIIGVLFFSFLQNPI